MDPDNVDTAAPAAWTFGTQARCCANAACATPQAAAGSRRRRLWELSVHAHCPLVGVCLPMPVLRRLAAKTLGGKPVVDGYELHCGVAHDCKHRTRMAEAVQRELDRRFMQPLRLAAAAKTTDALAAWWQAQSASKDLPGAFWATLSHPRCTPALEQQVLGQVHMLQHQVGMATRVELARFEALIDENAVLARELGAAQRRSQRQAAEQAERHDTLQAELVRARGDRLAADSRLSLLAEDLQALRASVPDLEARTQLAARCTQQAERIVVLQRALQAARDEIERLSTSPPAHPPAPAPCEVPAPAAARAAAALADRAVLCVGGRTGSVPLYRRLVEDSGGRFLHHDGGAEQSAGQLESTLAAADLVICQAGCVSHNAYWRVKDHCKRTGKRCVFVETPSAAGLQRALASIGSDP